MASLRARLLAAVLVLAAAGLLLAGAIVYAEQRSFLFQRVDEQARSAPPAAAHALAEPESSRLTFEDLELDEDAHEVTRGGHHVELTATEYRLLRYLMLNPRRVLTRSQLLEHVWEYDFGGDARVLETYVSYLRKKLDKHGPPLIHTVRGVGYALRQPRT